MGYIKYVPRDLDIHMLKLPLGGCSEEPHGYRNTLTFGFTTM